MITNSAGRYTGPPFLMNLSWAAYAEPYGSSKTVATTGYTAPVPGVVPNCVPFPEARSGMKFGLGYDTTPAQVISLSVIMPGCSPGPSEWHYSKLDMNSSKIDRIKNDIAMPGCSPGPSLQQMYCNQSKPSWQNHEFDEELAVL